MWCFVKKVLARFALYTFNSHTKIRIVFRKSQSTNCLLESQPGKQSSRSKRSTVTTTESIAVRVHATKTLTKHRQSK